MSNTFNVSIAECEDQDLWQRTVLGVSQVGTGRRATSTARCARWSASSKTCTSPKSARRRSRFFHCLTRARLGPRLREVVMTRRTDRVGRGRAAGADRRPAAARDQGSAHRPGHHHRGADVARPAPRARLLQLPGRRRSSACSSHRKGLRSAAGFIRAQVARRLNLRVAPRSSSSSSTAASRRPSASSRLLTGIAAAARPSRERHPADRQAGRASPRPRWYGASSAARAASRSAISARWIPSPPACCRSALGEATKIAQFLNTADKRYEGVIQLGCRDRHRRSHRRPCATRSRRM